MLICVSYQEIVFARTDNDLFCAVRPYAGACTAFVSASAYGLIGGPNRAYGHSPSATGPTRPVWPYAGYCTVLPVYTGAHGPIGGLHCAVWLCAGAYATIGGYSRGAVLLNARVCATRGGSYCAVAPLAGSYQATQVTASGPVLLASSVR